MAGKGAGPGSLAGAGPGFRVVQMRRGRVLAVLASVVAVQYGAGLAVAGAAAGGAVPAARAAVPAARSWGTAIEVPGLGALNKGGGAGVDGAGVDSVSCASSGNCAAGGNYTDSRGGNQEFVAVEQHGSWQKAIGVPGLAALNTGGFANVFSVSCGAPGDCAAGGDYSRGSQQGFVVLERHGRWGKAIEVPGLAALNKGDAEVGSVSCASAGNCAAGGSYTDGDEEGQGFVIAERDGRWGKATAMPGLAALNKGGEADVFSLSCGSPGNCAAGGFYTDRNHGFQGYVAIERHGRWRTAIEVPGLAALNKNDDAQVFSVSCAPAGSCAAGGSYFGSGYQGFTATERHGRWAKATGVPGLPALNKDGIAEVNSVACPSAGNCAIGGFYKDHGALQGFVAGERHSSWRKAIKVPGLPALNKPRHDSLVLSVSCASAGNCAAGGSYTDGHSQGFAVVEAHGRWGTATEMPGPGILNHKGAAVSSVSCAPAGSCAAGGSYADSNGNGQGFVASQKHGRRDTATQMPGPAP